MWSSTSGSIICNGVLIIFRLLLHANKNMQIFTIQLVSLFALLSFASGFSSSPLLQCNQVNELFTQGIETGRPHRANVSLQVSAQMFGFDDSSFDDSNNSIGSMDREIVAFIRMGDDATRREAFQAFAVSGMQRELERSGAKAKDLVFVKEVTDALNRLGQVAQNDAWMQYFESGFEVPEKENGLWMFVDMLIQFKMLVHKKDKALSSLTTSMMEQKQKKKPKCGECQICSCSKKVHPSAPVSSLRDEDVDGWSVSDTPDSDITFA